MISFFKVNDPYRLFWLGLGFLIIRLVWLQWDAGLYLLELKWVLLGEVQNSGLRLYSEVFDYTSPLCAWFFAGLNYVFGRALWIRDGLAIALILIQAGIFNAIILRHKVFTENTYVPALAYAVAALALSTTHVLSPQLIGLTFVLSASKYLVRRMQRESADHVFLFAGIHLSLATLVYFPYIYLFPLFVLAFVSLTSTDVRQLLLILYGFLLVYAALILLFSSTGQLGHWWRSLAFHFSGYEKGSFNIYRISLPVAIFAWSLLRLHTTSSVSQLMKVKQFFFAYFLIFLLLVFSSGWYEGLSMTVLLPAIAFYFTHLLLIRRRKFWNWLVPNVLVIGLVSWSFVVDRFVPAFDNFIPTKSLLVSRTAVRMPLGEINITDLQQPLATPFLHPEWSEQRLDDLNYFQSSMIWREFLLKAQVDEIRDPNGIFQDIERRFPEFTELYSMTAPGFYTKN